MVRVMRWLKKLLTGQKEAHEGLKENPAVSDLSDGANMEKRRWSFAKHRRSGVDGGRRPSEAAAAATVAAVAAEPSAVRPCHCGEVENARARRESAAIVIQKAYRGYLARKALRALRSLVKLQALVRGYLVRKQAATTLHRLQALMRLQASSRAATRASYRKSMEQEKVPVEETRLKTAPEHRRRLSDSMDSNYERSPRIVEMDTCHLRSRSSRITSRHSRDHSSDCLTPAPMPPPLSCSSPMSVKQPPRLSIQRSHHDERARDTRHAKTAHNTPRLGCAPPYGSSPAKSVDGMARRLSHRDALVSPRYMAGTASSAARTRCQSAPRQRRGTEAPARASLTRAGSRRSCSRTTQDSGFCFECSEGSRPGYSEELSDEAARDYYLDRMW
ncbi:hypothetical protein E2562_013222 [Oryza meyeriana var. granulata]|uniref:DUF4005 domain-containing protein n=2 Tax=Oryza meyeriana var. granulata TaxID=110450 RepID=A0A6G1D3X5_9ORYZ|nr:hypothetical protein E2562_013222 [Oryza meyeriana var. granulata]KAF0906824.1 hypothetical protein E2562_013222 [Oryza meyeriana var. granulata]